MDFITESLRADWQAFLAYSPRVIYAVILLLLFAIAARLAANLVGRVMRRSSRLSTNERYVRRLVTWAIRIVGFVAALGVMGFEGVAASLLATGGVVAIVLGFAFKEVGENLLAGVFLAFSRPFEVGDLIRSGDLTGTVRAIEIRSVHIRTFDACDVFVPSAQIFRNALYNWTRDRLRRPTFTIGVAYDDEPERVIGLLEEAVRETNHVLPEPKGFVSIGAFEANWIVYEVIFWVEVAPSQADLVRITNQVKVNCWRALREAGVTFSTDIAAPLEIRSVPPLMLEGRKEPG